MRRRWPRSRRGEHRAVSSGRRSLGVDRARPRRAPTQPQSASRSVTARSPGRGRCWSPASPRNVALLGQPLCGQLRLYPERWDGRPIALSGDDAHHWWPIAPLARAEVELDQPALTFKGQAYLDANHGREPLEAGFQRWSWARLSAGNGAIIVYDAHTRGGARRTLVRRYDAKRPPELSPALLRPTQLGLSGCSRLSAGAAGQSRHRSSGRAFPGGHALLCTDQPPGHGRRRARLRGRQETLSLDRFEQRWVQALLGFRTRRAR